jgi:hypothetical protein
MQIFCPLLAGLLLIMQCIINKPFGQKIDMRVNTNAGQKFYNSI